MGLNIILYRITGTEKCETWGGILEDHTTMKTVESFDSLRYAGDRDFAGQYDLFTLVNTISEDHYHRPKDFEKCKEFVKQNIPESNQSRLLKVLDDMEKDEKLIFYFSY